MGHTNFIMIHINFSKPFASSCSKYVLGKVTYPIQLNAVKVTDHGRSSMFSQF